MNYEIIEDLGTISKDEKGRTKKLIKVSWYGKDPGYEIRAFDAEGVPLKRPMLTDEEFVQLRKIILSIE